MDERSDSAGGCGRGARTAAVLLAAGESRRMGGVNKLLLRIDGVPLVRRQLDVLRAAGIAEIVVVLGHEAPRVAPVVADAGARVVRYDAYRRGQQGSVLAGLAALSERADPVLVLLGDLPLLQPGDLRALLAAWERRAAGCRAMRPVHQGARGNPVVVERGVVCEVLARGDPDSGLRGYLDADPGSVARFEAASDHYTFDLDTPEDIDRLERRLGRPVLRSEAGAARANDEGRGDGCAGAKDHAGG